MPNENARAKCQVHILTNGEVTCDRVQYAFGVCSGHYKQSHAHRPYAPLRTRDPEVKFISCTVRIRQAVHDQILLAAAERGITPYELHQQLLETWAERRLKKAKSG